MKKIGVITKPQGVRGEFRVKPEFYDYSNYVNIKIIKFNNKEHIVEKVTLRQGFVIFKVQDVTTRNEVELLRNANVYANINEELAEDEFYVSDMIGADVISNTRKVSMGKLVSIDSFGASDVYTVKQPNGKEFLFPNVRDVIVSVNVDKKQIYVDEMLLMELRSDAE